jgi:hypothetical protein
VQTTVPDIITEIDAVLASLTVIFPGIVAYFVYVGLRTREFERIDRSDIILILVFTLLFQIIRDIGRVSGDALWLQIVYFFIAPVLLGVVADISHRIFVTVLARKYQEVVVDENEKLKLIDVGNVSRWQKTVKSFVRDGIGDITKEYYVEIDLAEGETTKRGFLNGYSEDDVELIRYDDLAEKSFEEVGTPDIDESKLTLTTELIPRDQIASIRIYRVKMEDFELE